jgi:ribosomal protein L40E
MLFNCRECDAEVSREATSCPQCGAPNPSWSTERRELESKQTRRAWGAFVAIWLIPALIVGILFAMCFKAALS